MKLHNLIAGIRDAQNTKTASAAPTTAPAPAPAATTSATESKLASALRDIATEATTKTAGATGGSVVGDVMKLASEVAESEKQAALKEASLLGAALADAYIERVAAWTKAAGALPVQGGVEGMKVASAQADEVFSKYAEENPVLARQAIALGYAPTAAGLEKMAEDTYVQGYNDQVTEIHKVACDEFLKAAALTSVIIQNSAKE